MCLFAMAAWICACALADDGELDRAVVDSASEPAASPYTMPDYGNCASDRSWDDNADGTIERTNHYAYDVESRLVANDSTDTEDNEVRSVSYTFDEAGCEILGQYDTTSDDWYAHETFACECDEFANPVQCSGTWETPDWNSVIGAIFEYEYEPGSDRISHKLWTFYEDGEPRSWSEYRYEYDEAGRISREDYISDGQVGARTDSIWHADDRLKSEHYENYSGDETDTTDRFSTFDEHNRYATTTFAAHESGYVRSYTERNEWYDTIYHAREINWDYDSDGSTDVIEQSDCVETWPWSCTNRADGRTARTDYEAGDELADRPVDDIIDDIRTEAWTCP